MQRRSSRLVFRVSVNIIFKMILFMAIMSHSKEVRQATRAAGPCCHSDVLTERYGLLQCYTIVALLLCIKLTVTSH